MSHPAEQLSDYLDEELTPAERAEIDAHLAACAECRATLDELRAIVRHATTLRDVMPRADLWPGIERQLASPVPQVPRVPGVLAWRVTLSLPQLAAAAVLLVSVSVGSMWMLQPRPVPAAPAAATAADGEPARSIGRVVTASADLGDDTYDSAVADLQRVLREGRSQLDPATVEVLERNLSIIDQAIRDAHAALTQDPSDLYLSSHLVAARQRKLELLREASVLIMEGN